MSDTTTTRQSPSVSGSVGMRQPIRQSISTPVPHGLMFHHFHGPGFTPSQGSITTDTFVRIIDHYSETHTLLNATDYLERASDGRLNERDVCLTFDDSLRCQFELALPVLKQYRLTAFWFVYSSVVTGNIEMLEVYRRYRSEFFDDIDTFYQAFFSAIDESYYANSVDAKLKEYSPRTYLAEFSFYTDNDRKFRFIRDHAIDEAAYQSVMDAMMAKSGTSAQQLAKGLWMDADHLRTLHSEGHLIGLHSHTHPTTLAKMSADQQRNEYANNQQILTDILSSTPVTMSHPCNSYSDITLAVLSSLGIRLGFRSNMTSGFDSSLEHPREDHAMIVKRLGL